MTNAQFFLMNPGAAVLQQNLAKALKTLSGMVESKPAMPILDCIHIDVKDCIMHLTVLNMSLGYSQTVKIGARIEREFTAAVHFKTLNDLTPLLSPERVNFAYDENNMTLTMLCGGCKTRFKCADPNDFPFARPATNPDILAIVERRNLKALKQAVAYTANFVSGEKHSSPAIQSLQVNLSTDGLLTVVGADGYVLAQKSVRADVASNASLLVDLKALKNAINALESDDDSFTMALEGGILYLENHLRTIAIQLVEGKYPQIELVTMHTAYIHQIDKSMRKYVKVSEPQRVGVVVKVAAKKDIESLTIDFKLDTTPQGIVFSAGDGSIDYELSVILEAVHSETMSALPLSGKFTIHAGLSELQKALAGCKFADCKLSIGTANEKPVLIIENSDSITAVVMNRVQTDVYRQWDSFGEARKVGTAYHQALNAIPAVLHHVPSWEISDYTLKAKKSTLEESRRNLEYFIHRNPVWTTDSVIELTRPKNPPMPLAPVWNIPVYTETRKGVHVYCMDSDPQTYSGYISVNGTVKAHKNRVQLNEYLRGIPA